MMLKASHPVWPILRLGILMLTLTVILKLTASSFDYTEIRTIIAMFITFAGFEGASMLFTRESNAT